MTITTTTLKVTPQPRERLVINSYNKVRQPKYFADLKDGDTEKVIVKYCGFHSSEDVHLFEKEAVKEEDAVIEKLRDRGITIIYYPGGASLTIYKNKEYKKVDRKEYFKERKRLKRIDKFHVF